MTIEINTIAHKIDEMNPENFREIGGQIKTILETLILNEENLLQIRQHLNEFPRLKGLCCVTCPLMDNCVLRGKGVVVCGEREAELFVGE